MAHNCYHMWWFRAELFSLASVLVFFAYLKNVQAQTQQPLAPPITHTAAVQITQIPQRGKVSAASAPANVMRRDKKVAGWLGIAMKDSENQIVVTAVVAGSPAQKAGLQQGDILLKINQLQVRNRASVISQCSAIGSGGTAHIVVQRDGALRNLTARLRRTPSPDALFRMINVGRQAPLLGAMVDARTGTPIYLEQFRGSVVVLDFWSSYCGACRYASAKLNQWHDTYASKDVQIVGISMEPVEQVARAGRKLAIRFRIASDPNASAMQAFWVSQLPSIVVIDANGIVREAVRGYNELWMKRLDKLLEDLIKER